jgi:predicted transcriptional regulator
MDKKQLIEKAGNQKALAQLLGISQAAISQWKTVPEARIWQLKSMKPEWFEAQSQAQLP